MKAALDRVNQDRGYRTLRKMIDILQASEAKQKNITIFFRLNENTYAHDSTTMDLYLSVF